MKNITLLLLSSTLLLTACSGNPSKQNLQGKTVTGSSNAATPGQTDTTYMPTGFYYLAEEQQKRIMMRAASSNEVYAIAPTPFASVTDIVEDSLERDGGYTSLCMRFNAKGTEDLRVGTGNSLHPKLAAVIANKLMYVVDNNVNIKTGVMCVVLEGYSERQMEDIQVAVSQKK